MADITIRLTEEREAVLEQLRLRRLLVRIPDSPDGEPVPNPPALTREEFAQAHFDLYLDAKADPVEREVVKDLTPEEVQAILDLRVAQRPEPDPSPV